jgi:hypothetical protein
MIQFNAFLFQFCSCLFIVYLISYQILIIVCPSVATIFFKFEQIFLKKMEKIGRY